MTIQEETKDAIKSIEERLEAAKAESGSYPSDLLRAREALQLQLRISEFRADENIRIIGPEPYEKLPELIKNDVTVLTKEIRSLKPYAAKRKMYTLIDYMYNLGLAAGLNGEVVAEDECVPVRRADQFYMECPECGCKFDINLRGMLIKENDSFAVFR